MPGNPLVDQGSLNRVVASVSFVNFPSLNVTAPFLGRAAIRLALEGEATAFLPTMTGAVTSPEPYQMITLTMALLKTQALSAAYKAQFEADTRVGDCTVRPDVSSGLPAYGLVNVALEAVEGLDFSGANADFTVRCRGYYLTNSFLFG
jgi:hypothetical protein